MSGLSATSLENSPTDAQAAARREPLRLPARPITMRNLLGLGFAAATLWAATQLLSARCDGRSPGCMVAGTPEVLTRPHLSELGPMTVGASSSRR